jgi:glucose-1-phosphate thymidylyltransferase
MKAIILAAGFCTRLFPITQYFPKGLLTLNGKAILSYLLDDLATVTDIDSIGLVTNSRYIKIFDYWLKTYYPKLEINLIDNHISNPDNRLGAIGDLIFTLNQEKSEVDTLVLASDTLTSLKLSNLISFFKVNRGLINALFDIKNPDLIKKRLGCAQVDGVKLINFVEKPELPATTLTSIPYYIYPKELLKYIFDYQKSGKSLDAPGSIISWLIGKVPVFGYNIGAGFYYDVGTIETYNKLAGLRQLI